MFQPVRAVDGHRLDDVGIGDDRRQIFQLAVDTDGDDGTIGKKGEAVVERLGGVRQRNSKSGRIKATQLRTRAASSRSGSRRSRAGECDDLAGQPVEFHATSLSAAGEVFQGLAAAEGADVWASTYVRTQSGSTRAASLSAQPIAFRMKNSRSPMFGTIASASSSRSTPAARRPSCEMIAPAGSTGRDRRAPRAHERGRARGVAARAGTPVDARAHRCNPTTDRCEPCARRRPPAPHRRPPAAAVSSAIAAYRSSRWDRSSHGRAGGVAHLASSAAPAAALRRCARDAPYDGHTRTPGTASRTSCTPAVPLRGRDLRRLAARRGCCPADRSRRVLACAHAAHDSGSGTQKPPEFRGFRCGRYWDRTSDLFRVREARYRCANRPRWCFPVGTGSAGDSVEVATGFEPV